VVVEGERKCVYDRLHLVFWERVCFGVGGVLDALVVGH
jgi:hypothetical protein